MRRFLPDPYSPCPTTRWVRLPLLACVLALVAVPATASAATKTWSKSVKMEEIGGYAVKQRLVGAPHPKVNGHITSMRVNIVDKKGKAVPIQRLMLHHIVFMNLGGQDATCAGKGFTDWDSRTRDFPMPERFYAAGEERAKLFMPQGYGYPMQADKPWLMTYMVMNHRSEPDEAYIKYTFTYETGDDYTPVKPYWLDEANCAADPVYNVPGGKKKGATDRRTFDFTMPQAGRIIAGGGHVHGGAKELDVSRPDCSSRPFARSRPTWGAKSHPFYHVKPVLHEPGPINMTGFLSPQGVPVAKDTRVRLTSLYDARDPHVRVMGIMIVYVAPGDPSAPKCGPLPPILQTKRLKGGRYTAPRYPIPIYDIGDDGTAHRISAPPGRITKLRSGATIPVHYYSFSRRNVQVKKGAKITWRFWDSGNDGLHNVTLANGPQAIGTPNLKDARRASFTFARRGTYRIFCALHPVQMTERVVVK
jgi:plastocyanin